VDVGAAVRESGMTPKHVATAGFLNRGQQFGAAEFLVTLRRELREDEFALVVPQPVAPPGTDAEYEGISESLFQPTLFLLPEPGESFH
jgi:hypothetical protein